MPDDDGPLAKAATDRLRRRLGGTVLALGRRHLSTCAAERVGRGCARRADTIVSRITKSPTSTRGSNIRTANQSPERASYPKIPWLYGLNWISAFDDLRQSLIKLALKIPDYRRGAGASRLRHRRVAGRAAVLRRRRQHPCDQRRRPARPPRPSTTGRMRWECPNAFPIPPGGGSHCPSA